MTDEKQPKPLRDLVRIFTTRVLKHPDLEREPDLHALVLELQGWRFDDQKRTARAAAERIRNGGTHG